MKAEDIITINDLITFLSREKTDALFREYIIEVIGKESQENKELEDLIS